MTDGPGFQNLKRAVGYSAVMVKPVHCQGHMKVVYNTNGLGFLRPSLRGSG
jgi:hypothetical protein